MQVNREGQRHDSEGELSRQYSSMAAEPRLYHFVYSFYENSQTDAGGGAPRSFYFHGVKDGTVGIICYKDALPFSQLMFG